MFRAIEKAHASTESHSQGILEAIRRAEATTLAQFDVLVADAFERNGWSQRIGRPAAGDVPAPAVVKVYVSTVRAGFRLGLDVAACESVQELRNAIKAARIRMHFKSAEKASQEAPELVGVSINLLGR